MKELKPRKIDKILPLYFLLGEDDFRKNHFLQCLKAEIFPQEDKVLNYEYLLGGEAGSAQILDAARSPSWNLFSPPAAGEISRLVVIDQAEKIPPPAWKRISDCFINPALNTCLVFLIHRQSKQWSPPFLIPKKYVINFYPLKGEKLHAWIREEANLHGLSLNDLALQELVLARGSNLSAISGDLDKLALYRGAGGEFSPQEVREVTGGSVETSIFDLSKLIVFGQIDEALTCLNELLQTGEAPLKILNILVKNIRKLWLGREAWEKTGDPRQVSREAEVKYYLNDFLKQVKKFKLEEVPFIYRRLFETNRALKGGEKSPRLALERLIIDLGQAGGRKMENPVAP